MKKTLIKICGIMDPKIAQMSLNAGADFIGIVLTPVSSRYVDLKTAIHIAQTIQAEGAKPILVFNDEPAELIEKTAEKIGDCVIQFQVKNRKDTQKLMAAFETIPAYSSENYFTARSTSASSDSLILIDNHQPGSGQSFCWKTFKPPTIPWILAGGLNADNVSDALYQLNPTGVDVSSGVEILQGKKDFHKIKQFIQTVRGENFL